MRVTRFSALWLIISLISANFLLPWSAGLQVTAAQSGSTGSSTGTSSGADTTVEVSDEDADVVVTDASKEALLYRKTYKEYLDEGILTNPATTATESGEACRFGIGDATQLSASAQLFGIPVVDFKSAPPFRHGCFFLSVDKTNLYHSFKYSHSDDAVKTNKYYTAEFTLDTAEAIYGGCLKASATCNKDDPTTYDLFSKKQGVISVDSIGPGATIVVKQPIGTTYNTINVWSFNIKNNYRLLTNAANTVVYKIVDVTKSGDELSNAFSPPDFLRPDFNSQAAKKVAAGVTDYLKDYISRVNGLNANERRFGEVNVTGNAAESTFDSLSKGSRFGNLIGNQKLRLPQTETIDSTDPINKNNRQDFLLVEGEAGENPKKPPQLVISGPRLGINSAAARNDLIFDLVAVVKSETAIALRANNYFLFKLSDPAKLNKDQTDFFRDDGVDPDVLYIAIDLMGNIGFLVDDKSKAGGIFGTNKDRFDRSADDNLIAIGQFSAQPGTSSNNATGGPLQINLEEYRWLITKRVYNDPSTSFDCRDKNTVKLINFGEENEAFDIESNKIPNSNQLNCLANHQAADEDDSKSSWIAVWDLKVHKLDQFNNDECTNAFFKGGGFFGNVMGSIFCGMIGTMTGWAASAAGFSIDLVIDALGLQSS